VALKLFLPRPERFAGSRARKDALERFLREALITARLEHSGIIPIYDAGQDSSGRPFFTMRLLNGYPLPHVFEFARSRSKPWTSGRRTRVVVDVCRAVSYAHAKGIVHGDLKPENVMVSHEGEVYVLDWGLAREVRAASRQSQGPGRSVAGTPLYIPPEQARGQPVSYSSDVYGLGAILYTLLAGRRPYHAAAKRLSVESVLKSILAGPPVPILKLNPAVPQALVAICEKAMAREAADRFRRVIDLERALEAYLDCRGE
jgi:serine/threonine protein kinase